MPNTSHKYLAQYPIDPRSEILIVGTIHPHRDEQFRVPFFYGNVCSLRPIKVYSAASALCGHS